MASRAIFPRAGARAGLYEAFFLRACSPHEPLGVWIRHTVHKAPGERPRGSLWCTFFDARRGAPFMHKLGGKDPHVPDGGWIAIGANASIGPGHAHGGCGGATWSLRYSSDERELHHLTPEWLYCAPLPRTKLSSPAPAAHFDGVIELPGREPIELAGWPGMVGHNWGSEHAERWIWLHGIAFADAPDAWLDVAIGRLKLAGRMTPWVANGVLSLDGQRHRIGGLGARGLRVEESARGCQLMLPGERGLSIAASVESPPETAAGWRYSDPRGGGHDVINCSVSSLALSVALPSAGGPRNLSSAHGCAYELGLREHDHGVAIAPFEDG